MLIHEVWRECLKLIKKIREIVSVLSSFCLSAQLSMCGLSPSWEPSVSKLDVPPPASHSLSPEEEEQRGEEEGEHQDKKLTHSQESPSKILLQVRSARIMSDRHFCPQEDWKISLSCAPYYC